MTIRDLIENKIKTTLTDAEYNVIDEVELATEDEGIIKGYPFIIVYAGHEDIVITGSHLENILDVFVYVVEKKDGHDFTTVRGVLSTLDGLAFEVYNTSYKSYIKGYSINTFQFGETDQLAGKYITEIVVHIEYHNITEER